jgi:hypothetical protein
VQGGKKCWENIVTACKPCNQRKGGRTPLQASMQLIRKPKQPNWLPTASLQMGITRTPERWKIYLKLERRKTGFNLQIDQDTDIDIDLEPR